MLFLHLQHSSASSSGGSGWLPTAGYGRRAPPLCIEQDIGPVRGSVSAAALTPVSAHRLQPAGSLLHSLLWFAVEERERGGAARGDRHTREMRVTRVCTSSGLRPVHAHALVLVLVLLMPDGPAVCDGDGKGHVLPLSSNGVCLYVRTYIHMYPLPSLCTGISDTRLTPAPSRSQ